MNIKKKKPRAGLRCHSYRAESQSGWEPEISKNSVSNGELRQVATVLSQPYPGTADLCLGGPVPSPQLVGIHMENLTNNNKKKQERKLASASRSLYTLAAIIIKFKKKKIYSQ